MDESALKLSRSLEEVSRALAEWTVSRHVEIDPMLSERHGRAWRQSWVADARQQVVALAQAIAVGRPELFAQCVAWSRASFAARAVPVEDLRGCLRALRDVIAEKLPGEVANVAGATIDAGLAGIDQAVEPPTFVGLDRPHGRLVLAYLEALLAGERERTMTLVLNAVDGGLDVTDAYELVLRPAQAELGRMWHLDEISIADEHYATAAALQLMTTLRDRGERRPPNGRRVLVTTVGGELHALGARVIGDFFEMAGWELFDLGSNLPARELPDVIRERRVDLLAISAASVFHVRAVAELIALVRGSEGCADVKILVGGPAFNRVPDLWRDVGADGSAPSASEAVKLAAKLVDGSAEKDA